MTKDPILQPDQSYSFHAYFELPHETDEILAEFGYGFVKTALVLPQTTHDLTHWSAIAHNWNQVLPLVNLSSETAKREILVAPLLVEVVMGR